MGERCDAFNPCLSSPCLNNGLCVSRPGGFYQCICTSDFTGLNCESRINVCDGLCKNDGTCVLNDLGSSKAKCLCKPGFTGLTCSTVINFCASNPCPKFQLCINTPHGHFCACVPGFSCGQTRSRLAWLQANQVKKSVDILLNNPCVLSPCKNGGLCQIDQSLGYSCNCPMAFTGKFSPIKNFIIIKKIIFKSRKKL